MFDKPTFSKTPSKHVLPMLDIISSQFHHKIFILLRYSYFIVYKRGGIFMSDEIKKINPVKIILDIIIVALLIITCNINFIGANYRNIIGLALAALVVIHLILGFAAGSGSDKNSGFRSVLTIIINILLLLSIIVLVTSGFFSSRVSFSAMRSFFYWQIAHNFSAALSIILVGIHIGLSWRRIMASFGRFIKLPAVAARTLSIILALAIVGFGSYSIYSSGFSRMLTSPFTLGRMANFRGQGGFNFQPGQFNRNFNNDNNNSNQPDVQNGSASNGSNDNNSNSNSNNNGNRRLRNRAGQPNNGDTQNGGQNSGQDRPSFGNGGGFNRGNFQNGGGFQGNMTRRGNSIPNILLTYASIIGLFAVVGYYIGKLFKRKESSNTDILNTDSSI